MSKNWTGVGSKWQKTATVVELAVVLHHHKLTNLK